MVIALSCAVPACTKGTGLREGRAAPPDGGGAVKTCSVKAYETSGGSPANSRVFSQNQPVLILLLLAPPRAPCRFRPRVAGFTRQGGTFGLPRLHGPSPKEN